MTELVLGLVGTVAILGWLIGAGSALGLALFHRLPDRGLLWYAFNGWAFYSSENFAESGQQLHRLQLVGMALFMGAVLGLLLLFGVGVLE